jgi:hypothetical protein
VASRTPVADGLAIAPSELSELASHRYWGRYASAGDLPNAASNAAVAPSFPRLRAGDVAYVTGDSTLYQCTSPGTAGGADATWASLGGGGGAVQTVRSSYVFVVAQNNYLQALANQGDPPMPTNNANLVPAPSPAADVEGVTCDYLDTGNGLELDQALLAAAARPGGGGVDIRLRPCGINLADSVMPLVVPSGCRVIGAGKIASTIRGASSGNAGVTQRIFQLGQNTTLASLRIISPAPTNVVGVISTLQRGVIMFGVESEVRDCHLQLDVSGQQNRHERYMIHDQSATIKVNDCQFFIGNGWAQPTPNVMGCIFWGYPGYSISVGPNQPGRATNCQSFGGNQATLCRNSDPCTSVDNWYARDLDAPFGAFAFQHDFVASSQNRFGGSLHNCFADINNYSRGTGIYRAGFLVSSTRNNATHGHNLSSCTVRVAANDMTTIGLQLESRGNASWGVGGVEGLHVRGLTVKGTGGDDSPIIDYGLLTTQISGNPFFTFTLEGISVYSVRSTTPAGAPSTAGVGLWLRQGCWYCQITNVWLWSELLAGAALTTAVAIRDGAAFTPGTRDILITNLHATQFQTGFDLGGPGGTGVVNAHRISNSRLLALAAGANGAIIRARATDTGLSNVAFHAAGAGPVSAVNILAGAVNAQVVGCNLGGLPILDAGVGTVQGLNVP